MNMRKWDSINWIFFDLDDTLWNFSENSEESLHKLYEISPILRKLFKDIKEFIDIYHKNNSLMWDFYSKGLVSTKELKQERWRRTLAKKQFEVLTAVCEELDTTYLEILAQGKLIIPGVKEMLQRLTKKYLIGILSNGFSKTQYQKLHYSGLDRFVTRTIVSEELGINKPNPKIFEYAIEETGAQQPYLMVGDNPDSDIVGAMRAGWNAIWFNPGGKSFPFSEEELREKGADPERLIAIVENTHELERAIEELFQKR